MPPIQYICKEDLPERLSRIHPPPNRLFCRGAMPNFDAFKCVAVVGARKYSEYGERACREIIKGLAGYPILIISGLAIGIDSIAHDAALETGILTVAVPGSSLEEHLIYPKLKLPLAKRIIEKGGCLLSEYSGDDVTGPWVFPERNRIMAGLSDAVLIIEAERKSGTSITARLALDYNKDVLAVPGSIFVPLSQGPNFLLKEGAAPVTCARDVIEALGLQWIDPEEKTAMMHGLFNECSLNEKELLALLPASRDEIICSSGKPAHEVQMLLSLLEIKGMVRENGGRLCVA